MPNSTIYLLVRFLIYLHYTGQQFHHTWQRWIIEILKNILNITPSKIRTPQIRQMPLIKATTQQWDSKQNFIKSSKGKLTTCSSILPDRSLKGRLILKGYLNSSAFTCLWKESKYRARQASRLREFHNRDIYSEVSLTLAQSDVTLYTCTCVNCTHVQNKCIHVIYSPRKPREQICWTFISNVSSP